jgi:peptidoglycan/xylan/chitin deacetylase (PgdA/CDA1 family)
VAFRVALTFDAEHPDRPHRPGGAEAVLSALADHGVAATFFLQGRWAEAHPDTARRIAADGHLVGNHSHAHARLPQLSAGGLATDIRHAEDAIRRHAGVDPRPWFRCPFGAGADDARLIARIRALGYREVGWDVSSDDWEPSRSPEDVTRTVVDRTIAHGDGAVVLHHTWPNQTLAAIPVIVARLRDRGATFVGLDELSTWPSFLRAPAPDAGWPSLWAGSPAAEAESGA